MINLTKTAGTAAQTYSVRIREPDSGRILTVSPGGDAHMHLLEEGLEGFGAVCGNGAVCRRYRRTSCDQTVRGTVHDHYGGAGGRAG